jgi:DNA polymerase-3 subunit alpha
MMPGKWNLARFLSEDEAINKKSSSSEEYDKIKKLISGGEDDLGGNHSTSKSVGRNLRRHTCLWGDYYAK